MSLKSSLPGIATGLTRFWPPSFGTERACHEVYIYHGLESGLSIFTKEGAVVGSGRRRLRRRRLKRVLYAGLADAHGRPRRTFESGVPAVNDVFYVPSSRVSVTLHAARVKPNRAKCSSRLSFRLHSLYWSSDNLVVSFRSLEMITAWMTPSQKLRTLILRKPSLLSKNGRYIYCPGFLTPRLQAQAFQNLSLVRLFEWADIHSSSG